MPFFDNGHGLFATAKYETAATPEDISNSEEFTSKAIEDVSNKITDPDSALSRTSTNAVQNQAVTKGLEKKLNLAGGTMTGGVSLSSVTTAIKRNEDDSFVAFFGDSKTDSSGCCLILRGRERSNFAGYFSLRAGDGNSAYTLSGSPDGSLTWGGIEISLSGHTHSYLPSSGGTLTGGVTRKASADNDVSPSSVKIDTVLNVTDKDGVSSFKIRHAQYTDGRRELQFVPCKKDGSDGTVLALRVTSGNVESLLYGGKKVLTES